MSKKTRKAFIKRFKLSSTGKVLYHKPNYRHFLRNKTSKQKRNINKSHILNNGQIKYVKEALLFNRK